MLSEGNIKHKKHDSSHNTFTINERKKDYAVLNSIGATEGQILNEKELAFAQGHEGSFGVEIQKDNINNISNFSVIFI